MATDTYLTDTVPSADRLPRGYFVATSLADRMLIVGKDGEVWGDAIDADELDIVVEDARNGEAIGDCERCGDSVLPTDPHRYWAGEHLVCCA